jgi:hypothetical protein
MLFRSERLGDGSGILRGDPEQRAGRPVGMPPSLLPVLQGGNADADHPSELRLGLREPAPERLDVVRREVRAASGLRVRTEEPGRKLQAGHALEERLEDERSVLTNLFRINRRSIRRWRTRPTSFTISRCDVVLLFS